MSKLDIRLGEKNVDFKPFSSIMELGYVFWYMELNLKKIKSRKNPEI